MTTTDARIQAPYGTWRSPPTAELLGEHSRMFTGVEVDGGDVYWLEQRPAEDRAVAVCRAADGAVRDISHAHVDVELEGETLVG